MVFLSNDILDNTIYLLQNEIYSIFFNKYNFKKVTSLNIIEGENAVQLYGDYGKKGVVVMTTKGLSSKEKLLLQEKNINFNKN